MKKNSQLPLSEEALNTILGAAVLATAAVKNPTHREQAAMIGKDLYQTFLGFQDAGFNENQAFELVLVVASK